MAESETKRPRRTPQERAAAVDEKIAKFNQSIAELEEKKTAARAEYDAKITVLASYSARAAEYDAKITVLQERVKALEAKKQEILAPKPPRKPRKTKKQKIQEIVQQAVKSGMSVEDVASKLQVEIAE